MMNHHSVPHLCMYRAAWPAKKETSQQLNILVLSSFNWESIGGGNPFVRKCLESLKSVSRTAQSVSKDLELKYILQFGGRKTRSPNDLQIKYKNKSTLCWYYIIFILIFDLIFFSLKRKFGTPTPLFYHHFILPSLFIFSCQSSSIPTLELIT